MAIPSQSYFFVTGAVPTATQWNSNFVTLVAAFSNIDYTNIGAAGIYASQLKPTSASAATFGGSQTYTFPVGVAMAGPLTGVTSFSITGAFEASSNASTLSFVPPVYTATGTAVASTAHIVTGSATITANSGFVGTSTITLSGAAQFTSSTSYAVYMAINNQVTTISSFFFYVSAQTATGFQINLNNTSGSNITSATVNWIAIGT
jgi:hypothetical protein